MVETTWKLCLLIGETEVVIRGRDKEGRQS